MSVLTSLAFAQGDFYTPQVAKTNAESNQNISDNRKMMGTSPWKGKDEVQIDKNGAAS